MIFVIRLRRSYFSGDRSIGFHKSGRQRNFLDSQILTLLVDAEVQLAQQLGLAGGLVVDGELLSGRELTLTQVTGEAGQVVDRRGSLSDPVRRRDQAKAFGTLDRVADQLGVVLATVDATVFDETRLLLTQQVIALRTPDTRENTKGS